MEISVKNHTFFPSPRIFNAPAEWFPLELDTDASGKKTRMMGLPDGQKKF